jgi:hypothetical protein
MMSPSGVFIQQQHTGSFIILVSGTFGIRRKQDFLTTDAGTTDGCKKIQQGAMDETGTYHAQNKVRMPKTSSQTSDMWIEQETGDYPFAQPTVYNCIGAFV